MKPFLTHLWVNESGTERVVGTILVSNNYRTRQSANNDLPPDQAPHFELDAVVDGKAMALVLPQDVADRLELPSAGATIVHYGDGSQKRRPRADQVQVEVLGRVGTFQAVLEPNRTTALLGAVVLESLDLIVDCGRGELKPRDPDVIIEDRG